MPFLNFVLGRSRLLGQSAIIPVAAVTEKAAPGRTACQPSIVFTTVPGLWCRFKGIKRRQQFRAVRRYKHSTRGFTGIGDLLNLQRYPFRERVEQLRFAGTGYKKF